MQLAANGTLLVQGTPTYYKSKQAQVHDRVFILIYQIKPRIPGVLFIQSHRLDESNILSGSKPFNSSSMHINSTELQENLT